MKIFVAAFAVLALVGCSRSTEGFKAVTATPLLPQFETSLEQDLLKLQKEEVRGRTRAEIQKMNERTLSEFHKYKISRSSLIGRGERIDSLPQEWASKVLSSVSIHPVVGQYSRAKYDSNNVQIGFCFGRATYAHLVLLKMGVNKNSIRKIWAVGSLKTSVTWAFHVATIVYNAELNNWLALDEFTGQVVTVDEWVTYMQELNEHSGNMRVYITSPQKFSVSLGRYSRVELGLDLDRDKDWYRHYFLDLLSWFKARTLESVGLKDLRKI